MYNLNFFEEMEYNFFCSIIDNKGVYPYIKDDILYVLCGSNIIFSKCVFDVSVLDVSDVLGISLVDGRFVCYFIKRAFDNGIVKVKKKSL
ncbi:MAG: hypothetical protein J6D28_06425 [Bacilli bacterium]|nr:hypothetical protein [Bacilli bacterium]